MKNDSPLRNHGGGFTLVEMAVILAIFAILLSFATASWDTIKARVRWSAVKGNMDGIARAAFTDFSNNECWAPLNFGAMPTGNAPGCPTTGFPQLLAKWPEPPCPGWFYSWEDWEPTDSTAWVTLRRQDTTAFLAYCVATFGGSADACKVDPLHPPNPPTHEISSNQTMDNHIFCSE